MHPIANTIHIQIIDMPTHTNTNHAVPNQKTLPMMIIMTSPHSNSHHLQTYHTLSFFDSSLSISFPPSPRSLLSMPSLLLVVKGARLLLPRTFFFSPSPTTGLSGSVLFTSHYGGQKNKQLHRGTDERKKEINK